MFLRNSGNKAALAEFISNHIVETAPQLLEQGQNILLAGGFQDGTHVKRVNSQGSTNEEELYCTHEEADTRMVFHATSAIDTYQRVIIRCDDTDVLVLLMYYYSKEMLPEFTYMHAGHSEKYANRDRFIPIKTICSQLGDSICQSLPAVHALTGCDSTSSIHKIGKKTAFNKLQRTLDLWPTLASFGTTNLDESLSDVQSYTLSLYGNKKKETGELCSSLDELRYVYATTTDKPASTFPPTEDAFHQHVKRGHYQVTIWCCSHEPRPTLATPVGNGWKLGKDGLMEPVLFVKDPGPIKVRDLTHLYCTDQTCHGAPGCHCCASGLQCT